MADPLTIQAGDDGIHRMTLSRPDAMNSLDRELVAAMTEATVKLHDDLDVRVVVVDALGDRAFCAGADLKERATMSATEVAEAVAAISRMTQALAEIPVPTIAAITGAALGGGLEIALACDVRIASSAATLGLPETTLAILPGGGGTQRLPRIAGVARALELILTGRRFSAGEALQYGILHEVVGPDEVRQRAAAVARTIASNGPIAVRAAKEAILRGMLMPMDEALALEQELYGRTIESKDRLEGLQAFREKRPPVYRGE